MYQHIKVPEAGQKITVNADFSLNVPDQPIIPFIEGDGTGLDITPVMIKVVDAAVAKAYGGKKKIQWMEVYAGEKSTKVYGPDVWLPPETLAGGQGLRRLDQGPADHAGRRRHPLAERRAAPGTRPVRLPAPDPVLRRRAVAGQGAAEGRHGDLPRELRRHLRRHRVRGGQREGEEADRLPAEELGVRKIRFPNTSGIGIKPGLERRHRAAGAQGAASTRSTTTSPR
jgi:isocitrate dehydrogenase